MVLFQVAPGSFEFQLFFILTAILIGTKAVLLLYIGRKLNARKREGETIGSSFVFGIFILILSMFISRIFFTYFDFILTEFDSEKYYLFPNYIPWKIGMTITSFGIGFLLYVTDKRVLNFRLKGIIAIIAWIGGIIILVYPVANADDFALLSGISIISNASLVLIILFFLYIGVKTPGSVRRNAILIVLGGICYALAAIIVNEAILTQLRAIFGSDIHIVVFFLFILLKVIGLILMSYSFSQFSL